MFFLFEKRRCWVRSHSHTTVFENEPEFEHFVSEGDGELRTFVRIWLMGWEDAPSYVGGVWTQNNRVQRSELQRVAQNVVRLVGKQEARPLVSRLIRQLDEAAGDTVPTQ